MGKKRNAKSFSGKFVREIGWNSTKCIHLAQDRDQWKALVNMVMNLLVP
jgi:hypothetical protein